MDREAGIQETAKHILELSQEHQNAIVWLIRHIDLVEKMVAQDTIPIVEIEKWIEDAWEKKDYIQLVIALYAQNKSRIEREIL